MELEIVAGSRYNSNLYKIGSFIYQKSSTKRLKDGTLINYFVCYESKCKATMNLRGDVCTLNSENHSHEPNLYKYLKNKMLNEIKLEIRKKTGRIRAIFDRVSIKPEYKLYVFNCVGLILNSG